MEDRKKNNLKLVKRKPDRKKQQLILSPIYLYTYAVRTVKVALA